MGGTGALTSSNSLMASIFSSNIALILKGLGNDNSSIVSGTNASSPVVYINQNGTITLPCSENIKILKTRLNR